MAPAGRQQTSKAKEQSQSTASNSGGYSPRSKALIHSLVQLLEPYNYGEVDIYNLIKRCGHNEGRIQAAVSMILDEKAGHEQDAWATTTTAEERKVKAQEAKERRQQIEKIQAEERERLREQRTKDYDEKQRRLKQEVERRKNDQDAVRLGRKAPGEADKERSQPRSVGSAWRRSEEVAQQDESPAAPTSDGGEASPAEDGQAEEEVALEEEEYAEDEVEVEVAVEPPAEEEGEDGAVEDDDDEDGPCVMMPPQYHAMMSAGIEYEVVFGSFGTGTGPAASSTQRAPHQESWAEEEAPHGGSEEREAPRGRNGTWDRSNGGGESGGKNGRARGGKGQRNDGAHDGVGEESKADGGGKQNGKAGKKGSGRGGKGEKRGSKGTWRPDSFRKGGEGK